MGKSSTFFLTSKTPVNGCSSADRMQALKPNPSHHSKQATVIATLKRPECATIQQIVESKDWQPHTVRCTFAGVGQKKLGLDITSRKDAGARWV